MKMLALAISALALLAGPALADPALAPAKPIVLAQAVQVTIGGDRDRYRMHRNVRAQSVVIVNRRHHDWDRHRDRHRDRRHNNYRYQG